MAIADRYSGKNLYVRFITASGTANLSGDFRKLTVNRKQQTWDATAAADGAVVNKATVKEFDASLESLYIGTAGTAAFNIASLGAEGTLEYFPEGTATGKPKGSFPAIVTEQPFSTGYNEGTMVTISWKGQGAEIKNPFVDVA